MRFLDTDAACARVFVTNSRGLNRVSTPVLRSTSRDRIVGIAQDEYTGERIQIQAKGYRAADCSGDPIDFSKVEERVFASGEVKADVLLVLKGGMTADAGGGAGGGGGTTGGGAGGGGGGPDAGGGAGGGGGSGGGGNLPDGGTAELCGNTVDDDGDALIDCFDPECLLQDCNFGRRCTSIGVCMVPPKEMVCNDGLDDDNDTEVDCADPDCNNKSCADALMCTYGETCQAKVCTPAKTITCATPGECQMGAGTCLADAGCGYASKANATPCDGGACQTGECVLGFPYAPSNGAVANQPASAIAPRIRLDCGVSTFNSDTLAFGNWCSQTQPAPQLVNRLGVQNLIVLPMAGLEVVDELRITGGNPVILLVFGDARISGRIDVSGRGPLSGGGGPASNCLLQGDPLTPPLIYAGGGGGGAGFAQPGSKGGNSNGNLFSGGPAGGTYLVAPNVILRGGCAGSDGASGVMGQQAALGGGAGGAVQVSVSGTLVVEGRVMANGGGGQGGVTFNAGGGGGASGGGIVLEANVLDVRATALITAHGGGGGGGARDNDDGANGQDGHSADNNVAQGGAKGGGQAGDGANGGATGGPGNAGDGSTSAGGGGGGGVGKIHLRSIQTCLTAGGRLVSPVPSGNCP